MYSPNFESKLKDKAISSRIAQNPNSLSRDLAQRPPRITPRVQLAARAKGEGPSGRK